MITAVHIDETTVLAIEGDITLNAKDFRPVCEAVIAAGCMDIIVDVTAATGLGVDGVALIYWLFKNFPFGGSLRIWASKGLIGNLVKLIFARGQAVIPFLPIDIEWI